MEARRERNVNYSLLLPLLLPACGGALDGAVDDDAAAAAAAAATFSSPSSSSHSETHPHHKYSFPTFPWSSHNHDKTTDHHPFRAMSCSTPLECNEDGTRTDIHRSIRLHRRRGTVCSRIDCRRSLGILRGLCL